MSGTRKQNDSSSAVLLSVCKMLSNSTVRQREIEKERLQNQFETEDEKLNSLVEAHHDELKQTIQTFAGISSRITGARQTVKSLKETLQVCKNLLQCKRDDLRKYWKEGLEYSEMLNLLDRIDKVRCVPDELSKYMKNKYYLHATQLLVSTALTLEGSLSGVEALRELRVDLQSKKECLHEILIDDLNKHIYMESVKPPSSPSRSSMRSRVTGLSTASTADMLSPNKNDKNKDAATLAVVTSPNVFQKKHARSASRSLNMGDQSSAFNLLSDEGDLIIEDLNSNPEDNSCHFMAILVESLSLLGKIPEALEEIKQRMKKEMSLIIHRATAQVKENAKQRDEPVSQQNQPHLLLELLQVLFDKFRSVANAHNIVLTSLSRVRRNTHNDNDSDDSYELYAMEEVWSEIQFAIQIILSDYLDVANTQSSQHQLSVGFTESESEIGKYFAMRKRGSSRSTKNPLFRFEGSSSAISLNTYIREQRQEFTSPHGTMNDPYADPMYNTKPELLCKPDAKNITVVFCPVVMFAEEIEESVQTQAGMRCQLYGYIMDYVKEIFLGHIQFNCNEKLELLTKGPDAFKGLADANTLKNLGVTRPLLQSTVSIDQVVQGLKALMHNLPLYSSQFLDMICKTLAGYKEICYSAYRDIVKSKEGVTHIISATWAKDEDISRLLRSLPNWLNLTLQSQKKKEDDDDLEGIRLRNRRESELLTGNLQEHVIRDHEVIQDLTDLKMLSNLQETMEWLAGRIRQLATSLAGQSMAITVSCESHERMPKMQEIPPVDPGTKKLLDSLAQEFQNLAESCLLVLHLEIRCHCFYFLLPIIRNSSYVCNMESVDQDPNVIKLNKDLASLEEITAASLQPHKFRYLFEGLGDLISSILILGVVYIKKINPNGIKKMCRNIFALQQNLTNITMSREGDLDNARAYYELLYSNPEAILTQIIEQGPSFTEVQYANMLNLQSRSQTLVDQQALQRRLKKLKELKVNSIKPSQPKQ